MAIDFPNTPSQGQQFTGPNGQVWTWDGQKWTSNGIVTGGAPLLLGMQVFTTSGTYTPTPGMAACLIECVGGGAGGNPSNAAPGGTWTYFGSGGGSGGYSRKYATAAQIGASQPVTVGSGGAAGGPGTTAGGAGGDTSVGALCLAHGGGIVPSTSVGVIEPGPGGALGIGDFRSAGNYGQAGGGISSGSYIGPLGQGAPSAWGGGGAASVTSGAATPPSAPIAPGPFGAGGQGGANYYGTTQVGPTAGSPGGVVITEYGSGQGATGARGPAGASGAVTLIASSTVTTPVATIPLVFPANLRRFRLIMENFALGTSGANLVLQMSLDGGNTWLATATYYDVVSSPQVAGPANPGVISHNAIAWWQPFGNLDCYTMRGNYMEVAFSQQIATAQTFAAVFLGMANNAAGSFGFQGGGVINPVTGVYNAMRIATSAGNIVTGSAALYGMSG